MSKDTKIFISLVVVIAVCVLFYVFAFKNVKDEQDAQTTINGIVVPPEPNPELNNATLAGIDVNGNGVRDDVEQWIHDTYPESARIRAALMQKAETSQTLLTQNDSINQRLKNIDDATDCIRAAFMKNAADVEGGEKAFSATSQVDAKMFNTKERLLLYAEINEAFGGAGSVTTSFEDSAAKCTIDPKTLQD